MLSLKEQCLCSTARKDHIEEAELTQQPAANQVTPGKVLEASSNSSPQAVKERRERAKHRTKLEAQPRSLDESKSRLVSLVQQPANGFAAADVATQSSQDPTLVSSVVS